MSDTQIDHLSQAIASVFSELGVNPPFIETILLCDRRYVGRKYKAGGYQVIWWLEKTLSKFSTKIRSRFESLT